MRRALSGIPLFRYARALDVALLAVPRRAQYLLIALTVVVMAATSLPYVPRQYVDYSQIPFLGRVPQYETYGPDTLSDMYVSKVILNDVSDMYRRERLAQTRQEAEAFSKEATAPYPPVLLLTDAGLYRLGERTGAGFYGMILLVAGAFLALSAYYFLQTRWYLFPLLYLNFSYWGYRFVYVQDGSYLIMLLVVMVALLLARRGAQAAHLLMALAIAMKLLPLYYVKHVIAMNRTVAAVFAAVLVAGLVLPFFVWDSYLSIYAFLSRDKGDWYRAAGAVPIVLPFTVCLWYVETRLKFDLEDRIGWSLVPFAMFAAFRQNAVRHLLMALVVPDKRGVRNIAAGIGLALHSLLPGLVGLNGVLPIAIGLLGVALIRHLDRIGWDVVRDDLRHPIRTARMMLAR